MFLSRFGSVDAYLRVGLIAISTALYLVGCDRRHTNVERGNATQVLHRGIGPDLADLDPQVATGTTDYAVLSALFEGLLAEDPVDLHPIPGVAERWTVSSDGLVYTFQLRANARWSNGDPITANDFIVSWKRVLTPQFSAENASLMYVVEGAEAYHKGRLADFSQVGFAAPDARTVRITLENPTAYFLSLLQHWVWWPVPARVIEKSGGLTERGNRWARPETFVGNGPFVLKEWRAGQRIAVEKSPTYWDAAAVRLTGIHFYPIEDVNAEERAFRAGQLHLTDAIPVSKIDAYRTNESERLRIDPYLGIYFYRINVSRPFLNATKVRKALALAVDRETISQKILRGAQLPASAFTPSGMPGYSSPAGLQTDIAAARALLTEAGYPEGRGAPVIELLFNSSENHRVIAEAVQEMWRRDLGLDVRLSNMENKSVLDARRTGSFQILRSSWIGDYVDPMSFLGIWKSDSGNNYTGWANTAFDQLLYQAARTEITADRFALLHRAEELLLNEAPFIPIYHYTHIFLLNPSVKGWHPTLLDHHPYKFVWLEAQP